MMPKTPLLVGSSSSLRTLSRASLAAFALATAACTIEIQDDGHDGQPCPEYSPPYCPSGQLSTYVDADGCEVPECISEPVACPEYDMPACAPGEELSFSWDEWGCEIPVCSPPLDCPVALIAPCPPDSRLEYTISPDGCSVPRCVPANCALTALPDCAPGEHIEFISSDCGCDEPVCVPDYGCAAFAGASPTGIPEAIACPPGQRMTEAYDDYGCPYFACEPVICPSESQVKYVSTNYESCLATDFICPSGTLYYFDEACGCGCQQPVDTGCVVGGCSGQLCGEASDDLISTCEWRDSYGCYQNYGVCERQPDGQCGWTQNESMAACLNDTLE